MAAHEEGRKRADDELLEQHQVIVHKVHKVGEGGRGWTHIEDLDAFFARMYRYYAEGGFAAMLASDVAELLQFGYVVFFVTFLVHCVKYDALFRDANISNVNNVTFSDVVYSQCASRVGARWWCLVGLCALVGAARLLRSLYHLYHAYDTKMFYNTALHVADDELAWLTWHSVQSRVRDAQRELQMCIHKQHLTELDIYHRILRFDNYLVAMVNKRLLPLYVSIPCIGDVPYLSRGLKYNLELLLFYNPWSPWENCWHLRDCYKDATKRSVLAEQLRTHILLLSLLNLTLAPLIFAWQILYFFFSYAELIKRSPESLGLRTWSTYSRLLLRHFNELDHELSDRLNRAHKPATKYLASFPSPVLAIVAKNVAFVSASTLGVIIALSVYNEVALTVEHMLTLITALGCIVAASRSFIPDEAARQRSSEELLVQVLSHVHYLPASWRGKAHTKNVATHFQQLFQFKAVYILIELFSPIVCPFIIYSLRSRALDIVDFYRNFTVSVLDIGDVCSFAQMDVRRHGNPDWPAADEKDSPDPGERVSQYDQGEDGKTELSLVAFSCRNPGWRVPYTSQHRYLQMLHDSVLNATDDFHPFGYQNNLSYYQRINPMVNSSIHARSPFDERPPDSQQPDRAESLAREEEDMSISTLHLYDLHVAKSARNRSTRQQNVSFVEDNMAHSSRVRAAPSNEDTPLLKKFDFIKP